MAASAAGCLVVLLVLVLAQARSDPLPFHEVECRPLGVVSDISQHLVAHSQRLQGAAGGGEPRLPLPSLQELEAIKKVAQILVMLGEQVIPTIIGESPPRAGGCDPAAAAAEDVASDPGGDA